MALFDIFGDAQLTALDLTRESRANPLNNPAVSLSSPAIFSWLTQGEPTAAGEEVNHFTAMQSTSVYACVRVIAESVASLPLKLYSTGDAGRREAFDVPLHDILCVEPNPEMTAFSFWETMTGCLALTGNCYAQIMRNGAGQIASLFPLHPLKTEPYRTPDGTLSYRTFDGQKDGVYRYIQPKDIVAIPLFSYDGLKGLSPIMQARQAIGLAVAAEKFGARFFGNGSRPGGIITSSAKPDEKSQQNARESWERAQAGVNQGRTAFLFGPDIKYEQIGLSPEECQFLATRKFQREDIAALFRVPASMIGDTSRLSNTNHEQQNLTFLTDTIRPYLSRIENELTRKLLPSVGRNSGKLSLQFDVTERMRGDFNTQMKGYQTGVLSGWLSRNEVRKEIGENPGPKDLDVYMVPVNMQDSERLLDTESLQDQPIGGVVQPVEGTDTPEPTVTPTKQDRSALKQYRMAYLRLYEDAVGRICKRDADKRDLGAISAVFTPILQSIADSTSVYAGKIAGVDDWSFDSSKAIAAHLKTLTERAKGWKADEQGTIAGNELTRSVRAITFASYRAVGEQMAIVSLEEASNEE